MMKESIIPYAMAMQALADAEMPNIASVPGKPIHKRFNATKGKRHESQKQRSNRRKLSLKAKRRNKSK